MRRRGPKNVLEPRRLLIDVRPEARAGTLKMLTVPQMGHVSPRRREHERGYAQQQHRRQRESRAHNRSVAQAWLLTKLVGELDAFDVVMIDIRLRMHGSRPHRGHEEDDRVHAASGRHESSRRHFSRRFSCWHLHVVSHDVSRCCHREYCDPNGSEMTPELLHVRAESESTVN